MKGYKPTRKFVEGICFICGKSCDTKAYCHSYCAIAYAEEKNRRLEEAKNANVVN